MQHCDNKRFFVPFYKTSLSCVSYVIANANYLFDHDENATVDADSTISMFVADCIDSDRMCELGITK